MLLLGSLPGCGTAGSLESELEAGSQDIVRFGMDPQNQKSTGFFVCTTGDPVELVEVEPIEIVGEAEYLGAYLLDEGEAPIGAANGFPPEGYSEYLEPIGGAVVDVACGLKEPGVFAQVVVGGDWSGDSGGLIRGFRVRYRADGSVHSLEIPEFQVTMWVLVATIAKTEDDSSPRATPINKSRSIMSISQTALDRHLHQRDPNTRR